MKAWNACHSIVSKLSDKELDKERSFILKASKHRRWWTIVLKNSLDKVQNSGFFYFRRKEKTGGVWGQEVIDVCRHLQVSKGPRGMVKLLCFWSTNFGCCGLSHEVPINLLISNGYFCTYLTYLLGEIVLSTEIISVIPRLLVRFL